MKFSLTTIVTCRSSLSLSLPLAGRVRLEKRGKYDTWKIRWKKRGGKVLDYIVWKIDSDNIGEDLTKEREGNDGGNTSCARSPGRIFSLAHVRNTR